MFAALQYESVPADEEGALRLGLYQSEDTLRFHVSTLGVPGGPQMRLRWLLRGHRR